jgi:cytochrome c biogenesis protein CcmG/thiol:disulfide interchange protein DsbE
MKRSATIIVLGAAVILLIGIIFFQERQKVGSEPGMVPDLMRLQEDYKTEGLTILTVNMQKLERTLTDAPRFIDELDISLPVFFDENGDVQELYNIIGMPTTYIIGRDGTIEHLIRGEVHYEGLESLIEPLL